MDEAVKAIKEYREQMGLNQKQFAKLLKAAQSSISDIESGKSISKRMAKKLHALTEKPLEIFIK